MNVYEKIQTIKNRLLEENLKKSGYNKFSNYYYYELGDFLPSIIKMCNEVGLFTQVSFDNEYASLSIINAEKPEEVVVYTSPMRELELKGCNAIQGLGGVETYSRRYLYMSAFDIVENDMFDGVKQEPIEDKKQENKKISKEQLDILLKLFVDKGITDEKVVQTLELYKVNDLSELNETQYGQILRRLKGE